MNNTFTIQEYNQIFEQIELTEAQRSLVTNMLTEGLLDSIGKNSLIGFLKIIKVLWDAGWYTVAHPINTVKNIYSVSKTAVKTAVAAGAAYGAYAVKPIVDEVYMIWQIGQRISQQISQIKLTDLANPFQWKSIIETFKNVPSLANWANLTFEQKVQYAQSMGLSTNAYGDAAVKIFEIASQFAIDNAWVILAISLTMLAARFIGRFVSDKLQSTIDNLKQDKKTPTDRVEPTFNDPDKPK